MALGILFLSFVVLVVISILGISFLLLAKNNLVKKVIFYNTTSFLPLNHASTIKGVTKSSITLSNCLAPYFL